jgi:hypothetical protein
MVAVTSQVKKFNSSIVQSAHAFKLITSGLYSDTVLAIVRENGTNAHDSHIRAGNYNPFEVILPTVSNPIFSVRDFGVGMSYEEITTRWLNFFESSKTHDDTQAGMFGLGSKCALTYCDAFNLTAWQNGEVCKFKVALSMAGNPFVEEVFRGPSKEPTGVLIEVPIKEDDLTDVYSAVGQVYTHFEVKPKLKFVGEVSSRHQQSIDEIQHMWEHPEEYFVTFPIDGVPGIEKISVGVLTKKSFYYESTMDFIVGGAPYEWSDPVRNRSELSGCYFAVYWEPGILELNPSREGLKIDSKKLVDVKSKVYLALANFFKKYNEVSDKRFQTVDGEGEFLAGLVDIGLPVPELFTTFTGMITPILDRVSRRFKNFPERLAQLSRGGSISERDDDADTELMGMLQKNLESFAAEKSSFEGKIPRVSVELMHDTCNARYSLKSGDGSFEMFKDVFKGMTSAALRFYGRFTGIRTSNISPSKRFNISSFYFRPKDIKLVLVLDDSCAGHLNQRLQNHLQSDRHCVIFDGSVPDQVLMFEWYSHLFGDLVTSVKSSELPKWTCQRKVKTSVELSETLIDKVFIYAKSGIRGRITRGELEECEYYINVPETLSSYSISTLPFGDVPSRSLDVDWNSFTDMLGDLKIPMSKVAIRKPGGKLPNYVASLETVRDIALKKFGKIPGVLPKLLATENADYASFLRTLELSMTKVFGNSTNFPTPEDLADYQKSCARLVEECHGDSLMSAVSGDHEYLSGLYSAVKSSSSIIRTQCPEDTRILCYFRFFSISPDEVEGFAEYRGVWLDRLKQFPYLKRTPFEVFLAPFIKSKTLQEVASVCN